MRIVNIAGGLGNQMFQYAFALMLKKHFPEEEVLVDIHHYNSLMFKKFGSVNLHNGYEIDTLFENANLPIASRRQLRQLSRYIPNYVLSRIARKLLPLRPTEFVADYSQNFAYDKRVLREGDTYYEGYWQCADYYKDMKEQLRKVFAPPAPNRYNQEIIQRIEGSDSIGIHVRRGDYKNAPEFNGICTPEYYQKAIQLALSDGQSHVFYVFSNDPEWCKANMPALIGSHDLVIVDQNKGKESCWDMFLMTHCRQLIIANSTFSWWGGFLNGQAKAVYAPEPWVWRDCKIDILPQEWTKVKVGDIHY